MATDNPLFEEVDSTASDKVGDPVQVRMRHIVNRWVMAHHRPMAFTELEELIAFVRRTHVEG